MKLKQLVLAASFLALGTSAHASYYVEEDVIATALPLATAPASSTLATFDIGFSIRRSSLGASARHTLQDRLDDVIDADQVVVTGFGDAAANGNLARQRANAIKQWLVDSGVAAGRITVEEDVSPRRRDASKASVTLKSLAQGASSARAVATYRPEPAKPDPAAAKDKTAIDPIMLQMVNKIIAMEQNKLLRPEDAYRLLAELLQPRTASGQVTAAAVPSSAVIQQTAIVVPLVEQPRTWTLQKGKTLKENLEVWAATAGWAPPEWRAANPYRIAEEHTLTGTFVEVLGQLATLVPTIDLRVKKSAQTLRVVDAGSDVRR